MSAETETDRKKLADGAQGSLSRSAAKGFAWLMMQSVGGRLFTLLSQLVLARLLLPADFGLIALVYTVTNVAGVLAAGIDQVLLQRVNRLGYWAWPGFVINFAMATVATLIVLAASPFAAQMYKAPELVPLCAILSLSMPLNALAMLPAVVLRGALNFRFPAVYNVVEIVLTQTLTVILASRGFGAYSFVIPIPVLAVVRIVVFWVRQPVPMRLRLRLPQLRYLAGQGSAVLGTRLLTAAVSNADYFMLGLIASPTAVGLYFFAFRLAAQPMRMLASSFSNVLFPALAKLAAEPERQRSAAFSAALVLAYAVMPVCFMQATLLEPVLPMIFGDRWNGATLIIQILSLGLPFDAVSWVCGALLSAQGRFKRSFLYSCIFSPCFVIAVAIGAHLGSAPGAAVAVCVYYACMAPIYSGLSLTQPGQIVRDTVNLYVLPFAFSAFSYGIPYLVSFAPILRDSPIARVLLIFIAGSSTYLFLMIRYKYDVLMEIVDRFKLRALAGSARLKPLEPALRRLMQLRANKI